MAASVRDLELERQYAEYTSRLREEEARAMEKLAEAEKEETKKREIDQFLATLEMIRSPMVWKTEEFHSRIKKILNAPIIVRYCLSIPVPEELQALRKEYQELDHTFYKMYLEVDSFETAPEHLLERLKIVAHSLTFSFQIPKDKTTLSEIEDSFEDQQRSMRSRLDGMVLNFRQKIQETKLEIQKAKDMHDKLKVELSEIEKRRELLFDQFSEKCKQYPGFEYLAHQLYMDAARAFYVNEWGRKYGYKCDNCGKIEGLSHWGTVDSHYDMREGGGWYVCKKLGR